jgi:hypothetical protein
MKRSISGRWAAALLLGVLELTVPCVHGQAGGASQQTPPAAPPAPTATGQTPVPEPTPLPAVTEKTARSARKWSLGARVRMLPFKSLSVMDNNLILNTSTVSKVVYDFSYSTTTQSSMLGYGPEIEAPLGGHVLLTIEALFERLKYTKVQNIYWGTTDPTQATDQRSHKQLTENTQARIFDIPVLLHYGKFKPDGILSHLYVAAGATARITSTVRTVNNITQSDGTLSNNTIPAQVAKPTLLGGTVAVGFRFIDDFNIKVTPEVRYTHWMGTTFSQDSTLSPKNQLEIGIGFSK